MRGGEVEVKELEQGIVFGGSEAVHLGHAVTTIHLEHDDAIFITEVELRQLYLRGK